MPLTPSEELVARLARRTFLSPWSVANPHARAGKELCDLLVVCDPDVVVFSVKEVALVRTNDPSVGWQRWQKRAVHDSVKQVYGAERWLRSAAAAQQGRAFAVALPSAARMRVHRVAVALGGRGEAPFEQRDFGRGFVHVLDDLSLTRILGELDTVTDFVAYLRAKEALISGGTAPLMAGGEADLLAVYLHAGRRFVHSPEVLVIEPGAWDQLTAKPEWARRKAEDRESYVWDALIESLAELAGGFPAELTAQATSDLADPEAPPHTMAREDRFSRRMLARAFNEFMRDAATGRTRARIVTAPSGVAYVFLACDRDKARDDRVRELGLRCLVARGLAERDPPPWRPHPTSLPRAGDYAPSAVGVVVGLATERHVPQLGFSLDAVRLHIPRWTEGHQRLMAGIQNDLGYFAAPRYTAAHVEEYPPNPEPPSRGS